MAVDRRTILSGAGALPIVSMLASAPASAVQADKRTLAATNVTSDLVRFTHDLTYEQLPPEVLHAAKRWLIDSIGCGLAGWETNKGRLAAETMIRLGGNAAASVFGAKRRISVTNAAFANGELMNALDYDAIPHIPPVTIPALLAVAESRGIGGQRFLLAMVIAYELSSRLSAASSQMQAALLETNTTPEIFGINDEAIMATAAALARMIGLTPQQTAFAIGLGGYYCPPQSSHDWETGSPKSNVKYTPVGWVCQGAVTAALLAEAGYTANPKVLDGPAGFSKFYGWPKWNPAAATRALGEDWRILNPDFKPYAVCRYVHSRIDCLIAVMDKHQIDPATIESIFSLGAPFVANPDQMTLATQEDAQFSIPFGLALAANRIPLDAQCQRPERLRDPAVRAMMKKIRWDTHPRTTESKRANPKSYLASVSVVAGGKTYFEEVLVPRGTGSVAETRLTDEQVNAKFLANARIAVAGTRAERLLDRLWRLDTAADVAPLAALMRPA